MEYHGIPCFHGATYYSNRQLQTSQDVALGADVTLTGSSVVIEYTSVDA